MKKLYRLTITLLLIFGFIFSLSSFSHCSIQAVTKPSRLNSSNPLASQTGFFTENKGQWDPSILFIGNTNFGKVAFTKDAIFYQMISKDYESQTVKLSFVNPLNPEIESSEILPHYNNYFIGNDQSKWASHCQNYKKIMYKNVWTGIDLAYFFTPEGLKYEYYVEPDADIQKLQIKVEGANLSNSGSSLQFNTGLGSIQDMDLKVFDLSTNEIVPSSFAVQNNIYSFQGIPVERKNTIVIDPLLFTKYMDGSDFDEPADIVIEKKKNSSFSQDIYICGTTFSNDFSFTKSWNHPMSKGNGIVFVKEIYDFNLTRYTTFLGGTGDNWATGLAVDFEDNVYVCGYTSSSNFPIAQKNFQPKKKAGSEAFVAKINSWGGELLYSSYLGGTREDYAHGITVDIKGNAYICGKTDSIDFPTTPEAFQQKYKSEPVNRGFNAFITKINPEGTNLNYSTYLGSDGIDPADIALDAQGNVLICGSAFGGLPITPGAIQPISSDINGDGFITKINSTGSALVYSTYLGGTDSDTASCIAVDSLGNAYITGNTKSTNFPISKDASQPKSTYSQDAFYTKLSSNGYLLYSTFLGGKGEDMANGICLDVSNNIYICGSTKSTDFPTTEGAFQTENKGDFDVFITKLDRADNSILYSSYFGGTQEDSLAGCVVDDWNNFYTFGYTYSPDLPMPLGKFHTKLDNSQDIFVTKLKLEPEKKSVDTASYIYIELWIGNMKAYVNGKAIFLDAPPVIRAGRSFVPLRFVSESFGAKVEWDSKEHKITLVYNNITIYMWIDNPEIQIEKTIDGIKKTEKDFMEFPPFVINGRTIVPLRIIGETFGANGSWDGIERKLTFILKKEG